MAEQALAAEQIVAGINVRIVLRLGEEIGREAAFIEIFLEMRLDI